ncbi:MAG: DUF1858 domain-containing protein [Chloroflexi bacterium]|nr:DUF1858 domain-containing protein [Chloroflexota bacterium]MCL5076024.1 DUF1858 domain-containing protein [Chloroflexota bacterium]
MITKESVISEVIRCYPEARSVFMMHGMGCLVCMGAFEETIESGARMHRIDLQRLLEELNKVAEK